MICSAKTPQHSFALPTVPIRVAGSPNTAVPHLRNNRITPASHTLHTRETTVPRTQYDTKSIALAPKKLHRRTLTKHFSLHTVYF